MKKLRRILIWVMLGVMLFSVRGPVLYAGEKPSPKTERPELVSAENDRSRAVTVKWKKARNADGYEVQLAGSRKFRDARVLTATAGRRKVRFRDLEKGKRYYVRVRAFRDADGRRIFSRWSRIRPVKVDFHETEFRSVKAGKKSVTLRWKRIRGADGYEIRYSVSGDPSGSGRIRIGSRRTTSTKIRGLRKTSTYRFRIRAYRISGGRRRYTGWTETGAELSHSHEWRKTRDAWTEEILVREAWVEDIYGWAEYCNGCGERITGSYLDHDCPGWGSTHAEWEIIGQIFHEAVYETVRHEAEYTCSLCGKMK